MVLQQGRRTATTIYMLMFGTTLYDGDPNWWHSYRLHQLELKSFIHLPVLFLLAEDVVEPKVKRYDAST